MILEICANSIQSARNAQAGGAHRLELCQNIEEGGITPSFGLIKAVKDELSLPIHVLIRPRPGNFVYDEDEFQIMLADIQACRTIGCDGIAVGVLTKDSQVDKTRMQKLTEAAEPMQVTFHRAFDDCIDKSAALEDIISVRCTRILTSGGASSALEGAVHIKSLNYQAQKRIIILPAGRISASNVKQIAAETGVTEFHASASKAISDGPVIYHTLFHAKRIETDVQIVSDLILAMQEIPTSENSF